MVVVATFVVQGFEDLATTFQVHCNFLVIVNQKDVVVFFGSADFVGRTWQSLKRIFGS